MLKYSQISTFLVLMLAAGGPLRGQLITPETTAFQPGLISQRFVFDQAPFKQCHAATITETPSGLIVAWFGGTREKNPDVGIWVARQSRGLWSPPVEVANGIQNEELRYPCWNPVLYALRDGRVLLFFKVGPSPSKWWGERMISQDGGRTWSDRARLPEGILGPIKNKPVWVEGTGLLSPSSTEHEGWRVQMEWSADGISGWKHTPPLNDGVKIGAIQPTILKWGNKLQILCRTRQKKIAEAWSSDGGKTWTEMTLTSLPNPNSGIDAVTLADGRGLLVYNDTTRSRTPLNVAVSSDGKTWTNMLLLEDQIGEYSYPAVIQSQDGKVHITYTWKRVRVKHVVLDPGKLRPKE